MDQQARSAVAGLDGPTIHASAQEIGSVVQPKLTLTHVCVVARHTFFTYQRRDVLLKVDREIRRWGEVSGEAARGNRGQHGRRALSFMWHSLYSTVSDSGYLGLTRTLMLSECR